MNNVDLRIENEGTPSASALLNEGVADPKFYIPNSSLLIGVSYEQQ